MVWWRIGGEEDWGQRGRGLSAGRFAVLEGFFVGYIMGSRSSGVKDTCWESPIAILSSSQESVSEAKSACPLLQVLDKKAVGAQ